MVYPPVYGVAGNGLETVKVHGEEFSGAALPSMVSTASLPSGGYHLS